MATGSSVKELIDLLDVERVSKYFVAQAFSYFVKYVYTQSRLSLDLGSIIYILDKAKMSSSFSVGSNKGNTRGMDSKITEHKYCCTETLMQQLPVTLQLCVCNSNSCKLINQVRYSNRRPINHI